MTIKNLAFASAAVLLAATNNSPAQTNVATLPPPPKWDTSLALGVTLTRGNSETTTLSGSAATKRKWDYDTLSLGGDGLYGTTKEPGSSSTTENAETLHGYAQFDRNFTERFYGYARLDVLHDGIADIRYRVTLSPGAGYYFIKTKKIDLSLEVGPGYVTQHIGDRYESYATLRVGEKFHYALSDRARIFQTAEILPQVDYIKNFIINAEAGIEADLNKKGNLALRVTLDDTYNNVPATGRKKNDAKLVSSIVYKF